MSRSGRRSSRSNEPVDSGMAYCRHAGINWKTFYYWHNVIQKELLAYRVQSADVADTSSESAKSAEAEEETVKPMRASKCSATTVEIVHETIEPSYEQVPALPEPSESTSQEEVHFVPLKSTKASSPQLWRFPAGPPASR